MFFEVLLELKSEPIWIWDFALGKFLNNCFTFLTYDLSVQVFDLVLVQSQEIIYL